MIRVKETLKHTLVGLKLWAKVCRILRLQGNICRRLRLGVKVCRILGSMGGAERGEKVPSAQTMGQRCGRCGMPAGLRLAGWETLVQGDAGLQRAPHLLCTERLKQR